MISLFNKLTNLLNFNLNKELKEIYLSVAFRAFGFGLVGIFIPVFLYKLNYSFSWILWFYIFYYIAYILFAVITGKLAKYFGAKHLMFFSIPPALIFFVLLTLLDKVHTPIFVLGSTLGLSSALYWIGYHLEFAKFSDPKLRGREVSVMNIVSSVLSIFAPALGGLLIVTGGFLSLFIVVLIIFILSIVPLFMSRDIFPRKVVKLRNVFTKKNFRKDILPQLAGGFIAVAYADIWPLIIFLVFAEEYETLGLLFSAAMFLGLIFTYVAGKLGDSKKPCLILKLGGVISSFIWLARLFISGITSLFFVESLGGITKPFWVVPLDHYFYERALKSKDIISYVIFREIVLSLGAILFFVVLLLVQDIFLTPLLAALGGFLLLFI